MIGLRWRWVIEGVTVGIVCNWLTGWAAPIQAITGACVILAVTLWSGYHDIIDARRQGRRYRR